MTDERDDAPHEDLPAVDHDENHGHGEDHGQDEELGPVDVERWGAAILGVALGLAVAVCCYLATSVPTA
jgi:hypothetical protein